MTISKLLHPKLTLPFSSQVPQPVLSHRGQAVPAVPSLRPKDCTGPGPGRPLENCDVPNPRTGLALHLPNVSFARDIPVRQLGRACCSQPGSSPLSHFTPNRRICNQSSATSLIEKVERPLQVHSLTAPLPVVPTLSHKHLFLLGKRQATPQAHAAQQRGGAEGGVRWGRLVWSIL